MARAYGSSAHLLMKRETAYGQAATGDYVRMPFNRCNLGSEQGLIDDPVLGQGRDPLAPLQDVINDEGDIVVPVDPRYLGLWLTGLFGDPDMTDNLDGSWDHEFASGGEDLPSYTIEVGMPKVPAFFVHAGVKLNSIALEFTRSGPVGVPPWVVPNRVSPWAMALIVAAAHRRADREDQDRDGHLRARRVSRGGLAHRHGRYPVTKRPAYA
jgi:hypothetical protein